MEARRNQEHERDERLTAIRPWQDSNLQSLVPTTNALSTRQQGQMPPTLSKPQHAFSQHGKKEPWNVCHPFSLAGIEPTASATHGTYPRQGSIPLLLLDSCQSDTASTSGDDTKKAPIQCRREGFPTLGVWQVSDQRCSWASQRHKEDSNSMSKSRFSSIDVWSAFKQRCTSGMYFGVATTPRTSQFHVEGKILLPSMCARLSTRDLLRGMYTSKS